MVTPDEIKEKEAELQRMRDEARRQRKEAKEQKAQELVAFKERLKAEKALIEGVLKEIYAWKKLGVRAKSQINIRERISRIVNSGGD